MSVRFASAGEGYWPSLKTFRETASVLNSDSISAKIGNSDHSFLKHRAVDTVLVLKSKYRRAPSPTADTLAVERNQ